MNQSVPKRIYLTGFMAAGKSTIGRILANTIGYDFVDLDHYIIEKEGMCVPDIFKNKGENYFRDIESKYLIELSNKENLIISLGGGTVCFCDNLDVVKSKGILIYLRVSERTIFYRVKAKRDRPLFLDEQGNMLPDRDIHQKIEHLMQQRKPFYDQATFIFDTNDREVGYVVEGLKRKLQELFGLN